MFLRKREIFASNYSSTLRNLFSRVQNKNRHGLASSDFELRKEFFKNLALNVGLFKRDVCIVHVAGTKGKGSTCEYLRCGLENNKYNVGIFTSPHLHTACERIRVNGNLISQEDFCRLADESVKLLDTFEWHNFFDITFAIAIQYFAEQQVTCMILETGIGGRYDSTNIFDKVDACVITSISYDHQQLLGNSIGEIAWQKAGILKPDSLAFTTDNQNEEAMAVIREQAAMVGVKELIVAPSIGKISSTSSFETGESLDPSHSASIFNLAITHEEFNENPVQLENLLLANEVVSKLTKSSNSSSSSSSFDWYKKAYWPCRYEKFLIRSVHDRNQACRIVVDGAHNGDSMAKLFETLRRKKSHDSPSPWIVTLFGANSDKNLSTMVPIAMRYSDKTLFVKSKSYRAASIDTLIEASGFSHTPVTDIKDYKELSHFHKSMLSSFLLIPRQSDLSVAEGMKVAVASCYTSDCGNDEEVEDYSHPVTWKAQRRAFDAYDRLTTTGASSLIAESSQLPSSLIADEDWRNIENELKQDVTGSQISSKQRLIVVVCGSLYVAAEAREWIAETNSQLFDASDWVFRKDEI